MKNHDLLKIIFGLICYALHGFRDALKRFIFFMFLFIFATIKHFKISSFRLEIVKKL